MRPPSELPGTMPSATARAATRAGGLLLGLAILATGGWGVLALAVAGPAPPALRLALAAGFGAAALAALASTALRRWRSVALYAMAWAAALAWYFNLAPSNNRDWVTENARLPRATVAGKLVTVHDIRNFGYRSETDFTPAYYDKRFDLDQLEGVDLVAVYWMGPHIAHVMLSFGFAGGDRLAISIEARKEKGEGYSTVNGFFRQYELYYVVADERDVIGLRTNIRNDPPEQVYIYPLRGGREEARRLFMAYIDQINALAARPEFYNSLTTNCTTNIWVASRVNADHVPFSWKILASGHVPEYLYEQGRLAGADRPFAELQRQAFANGRAQAAGIGADFSRVIRDAGAPSRIAPRAP
ncbi:MAG: DUF4105 domain-containing protein [Burkholderiaceae bacterium]|nr:DUF4105 domain-containing protein [Burkholderiaceae bacterium]